MISQRIMRGGVRLNPCSIGIWIEPEDGEERVVPVFVLILVLLESG